jgi:hypothetical protein
VTRRERFVALRAFRGLLLALLGRPDSISAAVCGRELNIEVSRSRGEGRVDLEGRFGMVHEPHMPGLHKDGRVEICQEGLCMGFAV